MNEHSPGLIGGHVFFGCTVNSADVQGMTCSRVCMAQDISVLSIDICPIPMCRTLES